MERRAGQRARRTRRCRPPRRRLRASGCASSPGPSPPTCSAASPGPRVASPPAAAPWVFGPWLQPDRERERAARVARPASGRGCAALGRPDLFCTTCLAATRGSPRRGAARTAAIHERGLAVTTYFNPMVCASLRPGVRPGRGRWRADRERGRRAVPVPATRPTTLLRRRRVRLHRCRPGAKASPRLLAEAIEDGSRRLDGGLRRVHAARLADRRRRSPGTAVHNPYPRQYHCAAADAAAAAPRPIVRFQRSGWTGAAPCAAGRLGRRPDDGVGIRRPALRGPPGAQHRALGDQHLGLGHRRLLRDRSEPADAGAADRAGSSSAPSRA